MLDRDLTAPSVVIAYDDPMIRRLLGQTLERGGFDVRATATRGDEAVAAVERHDPELLLADHDLPDGDGVTLTRRLRREGHRLRIVILSAHGDDETGCTVLLAGANGYLPKDVGLDCLPQALHAALDGETVIRRTLAVEVIQRLRMTAAPSVGGRPRRRPLTAREWEVMDLLCLQRSTDDIAAELGLSPETVRTHVKHILHKTGAANRREAVERADELHRPPSPNRQIHSPAQWA